MARQRVSIDGVEELIRNMHDLPEKIKGKAMTRSLLDGAEIIGKEAQQRAPVLDKKTPWRIPGILRESITWFPLKWTHVIVRVRNRGSPKYGGPNHPRNPWWWWHVEFGTKHAAAQPFLRPAFEAKKLEALEAIVKALRTPIHTAARHLQKRRRWRRR